MIFFDRIIDWFRGDRTPKAPPAIDDRVRTDGGKPTDDVPIPYDQLQKIKNNAVEHSKDEPGS